MSLTEKLIECVKEYPMLYNMEHSDYKNIRKRDKVWVEIGGKLFVDGQTLKTKWRNMRDCYTKHLKSLKPSNGQSVKPTNRYRRWQWAQQMKFFRPFLKFSSTHSSKSNRKFSQDQPSPFFENNEETENNALMEIEGASFQDIETDQETSIQENRPDKEKVEDNVSWIDKFISYIEGKQNYVPNSSLDGVDLLFLGLSKTVKTFSSRRQAITKLKIANLVLEQEVEQRKEEHHFLQSKKRVVSSKYCLRPDLNPREVTRNPRVTPQDTRLQSESENEGGGEYKSSPTSPRDNRFPEDDECDFQNLPITNPNKDDYDIFGAFVATELRALGNKISLVRSVKRKIQVAILDTYETGEPTETNIPQSQVSCPCNITQLKTEWSTDDADSIVN